MLDSRACQLGSQRRLMKYKCFEAISKDSWRCSVSNFGRQTVDSWNNVMNYCGNCLFHLCKVTVTA